MTARAMTTTELLALPVTIDLVTAGRAFGIGRSGSYDLAARGEFPCRIVRVGRALRVPRAELLRVLGVGDDQAVTTGAPASAGKTSDGT